MSATASDDPRALLKAARKDRRITHPHASYTSSGNLLCNLCSCAIKSDAAWGAHLHSTGHTLRLSRDQDAKAARTPAESSDGSGNGKKRKASVPEEDALEERKKLKGLEDMAKGRDVTMQPAHLEKEPSTWSGATAGQRLHVDTLTDIVSDAHEGGPGLRAPKDQSADLDALEADLAALERESRATENPQSNLSGARPSGTSTISAPAMTAEQLAAQDREEKSAQRGKRDAELEDEKEEAAVRLEEEFEEMKGYEDRVEKLRERRELARKGLNVVPGADAGVTAGNAIVVDGTPMAEVGGPEKEDEDEDDEEDDQDDWAFGKR